MSKKNTELCEMLIQRETVMLKKYYELVNEFLTMYYLVHLRIWFMIVSNCGKHCHLEDFFCNVQTVCNC